ncbi:unnamed protein product [Phytophthora lilii]|uniref:Unnamed protein product n=1 Tax=Phytophthora lilii TaxID=2077276 RepID=A0A9W6TVU2_9STRA|nr:unnamed protein product [Phytophthora lilii]
MGYLNVCSCGGQLPRQFQASDAVVGLRALVGDQWSIFPSDNRHPQALQITEPGASLVAVNFKRLDLLTGDKLVVRGPNGAMSIVVTATNASSLVEKITSNTPHLLLLRTHPFLVEGDGVVVEYVPSIATLMLPMAPNLRNKPIVVMDSYSYVTYSLGYGKTSEIDNESTVGSIDESKEAVCYRKSQPKMYAKARAVARLMIRNEEEKTSEASEQVTNWVFCTGWLIGRGNYLITNHHCVKDAAIVEQKGAATNAEPLTSTFSRLWTRVSSRLGKTDRVVEAVVGFMAEAKSCRETGFMGEKAGVVVATRVAVIAENPELDYALLHVLTNDSAVDLARRYGYLRLRHTGPVDGEEIYIPQHPRGEPKEIAATKDGKPAVIEVPSSVSSSSYLRQNSVIRPTVWYNADTEPGSSGSPVLSRMDNTVVALHRAGNSETAQSASTELFNMGVRMDLIARDLQQRNLLPPNALAL